MVSLSRGVFTFLLPGFGVSARKYPTFLGPCRLVGPLEAMGGSELCMCSDEPLAFEKQVVRTRLRVYFSKNSESAQDKGCELICDVSEAVVTSSVKSRLLRGWGFPRKSGPDVRGCMNSYRFVDCVCQTLHGIDGCHQSMPQKRGLWRFWGALERLPKECTNACGAARATLPWNPWPLPHRLAETTPFLEWF